MHTEGVVRRAKKLSIAGMGAFALSAALLGFGAGTAGADDLKPDPSAPANNPAVEDGVRASGYQERSATQGSLTCSDLADPGGTPVAVQAQAPAPGDLSAGTDVNALVIQPSGRLPGSPCD